MLNNHLHFLANVVVVQAYPLVEFDLGFFAFNLLIGTVYFHGQVIGDLVIGVIFQHIQNKFFFNGLAHAVHMPGFGLIGFRSRFIGLRQTAEQLKGFGFWRCGKGKVS